MSEIYKQCPMCRAWWKHSDGGFCPSCLEEAKRKWERLRRRLYMQKLADYQPEGGPIYSSPPFDEIVSQEDLEKLGPKPGEESEG